MSPINRFQIPKAVKLNVLVKIQVGFICMFAPANCI